MNTQNVLDNVLELLYPSHVACCVCDKEAHFENLPYICDECKSKLHFLNGKKLVKTENNEITVHYAFDYDDIIKDLIHGFKYNGKRYKAKSLAYYLKKIIETENIEYDMIIPVPLHKNRQEQRGYNQCALLCKEVDKNANKYTEGLKRIKDTKMQTLISGEERLTNLIGAFEINTDVYNKRILLIDDIVTTGSTMKECTQILYKNGANIVIGAAIAT